MSHHISNDSIPPEWLAAYADGELDVQGCERVERWLAEHPEAWCELDTQQSLTQKEFRKAIAPPMPSQSNWDRVFSQIESAVAADVRREARLRRIGYLVPGLALVSLAASLLIALFAIDRHRPNSNRPHARVELNNDDNTARKFLEEGEDFVFQVAKTDDVELIHLPESAAELLVVGKHPLADVVLLLAQATDVQLLNYGPDDQGNLPDIQTTQGPDASMLWAPSLKP